MDEEAPCPVCSKSFKIEQLPAHVDTCLAETERLLKEDEEIARRLQESEKKGGQGSPKAPKPSTSPPLPSPSTASASASGDPLSQEEEDARMARLLQEQEEGTTPSEQEGMGDEGLARLLQEEEELTRLRRGGRGPPPTRTPTLIPRSNDGSKLDDTIWGKVSGGGIMRWLRMRDSGGAPATLDLPEEYKRLQKLVVDGSLPCTKRAEAIKLAAIQLAVKMSKAKPDELKKRKKIGLDSFFASYWLKNSKGKSREERLQEKTWIKFDEIWKAEETETDRMKQYVTACKALEYHGIKLYYGVVECRQKNPEKEERGFFDKALDELLLNKKAKEDKEREEKRREWERQNTVYWVEHQTIIMGVTPNCTLVKMSSKTKKVENVWKFTQIKRFELWRGGYNLLLDFGNYVPGMMVIRSAEHCQMIYTQLASFLSAATDGTENEDERRVKQRIEAFGLKLRPVAGDGNCQMRAIADQLWGDESRHVAVRNSIVRWLRQNPSYPIKENGRVISKLIDFLESDLHPTWEAYCDYMAKSSTWGDHLTLIAAAELYSRVVWVLSSVETTDEGFQENPWTTIEPHIKQKEGASNEEDDFEKQEVLLIESNEKEKESTSSKSSGKEKEKGKGRQTKEKESSSNSNSEKKEEEDKPILLCHWHERHYGSLATDPRRDNKGNNGDNNKKKRPSPRMVNPRYEDYKDWTY